MFEPMTQMSVEEAMISIIGDSSSPKEIRLLCKDTPFWQGCKCLEGWEKVENWVVSVVLDKGWAEDDWMLTVQDSDGTRDYVSKWHEA